MTPQDADRVQREGSDLRRVLDRALQGDFEIDSREAQEFVSTVGTRWTPGTRSALYERLIKANGVNGVNLSPDAVTTFARAQVAANQEAGREALRAADSQRRARYESLPLYGIGMLPGTGRISDYQNFDLITQEGSGVNRWSAITAATGAIVANVVPMPGSRWVNNRLSRTLLGAGIGYVIPHAAHTVDILPTSVWMSLGQSVPDPRLQDPPR